MAARRFGVLGALDVPLALGLLRLAVEGFLVILSNPKALIFLGAFLPQFVDPGRSPVWLQMLLLGPLLPILALPAYWGLIAGASRIAGALRKGRAARWLEAVAGVLFLGLGLRLLAEPWAPR